MTHAVPTPPARVFETSAGTRVSLAQEGQLLVELRGRGRKERDLGEPMRAFVGLANRARELTTQGYTEVVATRAPLAVDLGGWDAFAAYVSVVDPSRSLPQQELLVASSITAAMARREPRFGEALATLTILEWPSAFDVASTLEALDDAEAPLFEVLRRELAREKKRYPKELLRLAATHASPRVMSLALSAITRTRDPDAWMDVLIEGEHGLDATHLPAIRALVKKAPSRDVGRMIGDIAKDLERPGKKRRR